MIIRCFVLRSEHIFLFIGLFAFHTYGNSLTSISQCVKLYQQGVDAQKENEFEKALKWFTQSGECFQLNGKYDSAFNSFVKAAGFGVYLSEVKATRKLLDDALEISQKHSFKENHLLGDLYYYFGQYFYYFTNLPDSAHYFFHLSFLTREKSSSQEGVAQSLIGMGDVQRYTVLDYAKAEVFYEQALEILKKESAKGYWFANIYYSLGTTYRFKGDHAKALTYCIEAIRLVDEMNDLQFKEKCLSAIANIYFDMGQYSSSLKNFESAIAINTQINGYKFDRAIYLDNIGELFQQTGNHDQALRKFQEAAIILHSIGERNSAAMADILVHSSKSKIATNQVSASLTDLHTSAMIYREIGYENTRGAKLVFTELARYYEKLNLLDSSLVYYNLAIDNVRSANVEAPSLEEIGYRYYLFEPIIEKAAILRRLYDNKKHLPLLVQSLNHFALGEELLFKYRSSYDYDVSRKRLSQRYFDLYENYMDAALELYSHWPDKNDSLLFQIQEKSKAKQLHDIIEQAANLQKLGLPDSIRFLHQSLFAQRTYYHDALTQELRKLKPDSGLIHYHQQQLMVLEDKSKKFYQFLEGISDSPSERKSPSLKKIIQHAKLFNTLFINYLWGKNNLYITLISEDGLEARQVEGVDSINQTIVSLMENINDTSRAIVSSERFNEFVELSSGLYSVLLGKIDINGKTIVIIPDGPLYQVPFEIIVASKPLSASVNYRDIDYLIKKSKMSYAYSLSSFFNRPMRNDIGTKILAFAYSYNKDHSIDTKRNGQWSDLPGSETEVLSMKQVFKNGKFYFNQDATEFNFKESVPHFDLIHLAVHGVAHENPLESSLIFRQDQLTKEDGYLYTSEIFGLKLKAKLVVLSACEAGVGKFFKGEGIATLSSAFAYAGCPQVITSLWKVDDKSTSVLMEYFYKHLLTGVSSGVALTKAKIDYLENADELSAHPAYWASFISMGVDAPVFSQPSFWMWYAISITLSLIIIVFLLYYQLMLKRKRAHQSPLLMKLLFLF